VIIIPLKKIYKYTNVLKYAGFNANFKSCEKNGKNCPKRRYDQKYFMIMSQTGENGKFFPSLLY
jgi:hypothetical protein